MKKKKKSGVFNYIWLRIWTLKFLSCKKISNADKAVTVPIRLNTFRIKSFKSWLEREAWKEWFTCKLRKSRLLRQILQTAGEVPKVNLLVATLVAIVTFAAAFQLPGGYNDNGLAILGKNTDFRSFMVFDALAFGFSASSILIHFLAPYIPKSMNVDYPRLLLLVVTKFIITFMLLTYICGILAVAAENSGFSIGIYACVWYSFCIPLMFLLVYFLRNSYRRTRSI